MLFDLTKENINEFIHDTSGYVLIEFYSTTCRSCQSLLSILEDISDDYYGKLKVYKVNSDTQSALADQFDIFSLPTMILFNQKEPIKTMSGLKSYHKIVEWLDL